MFEPKYLQLFSDLLRQHPEGRGARFLHVLAPRAAPPALLESTVGGLPRVGCCAEVQAIEVRGTGAAAGALQARGCRGGPPSQPRTARGCFGALPQPGTTPACLPPAGLAVAPQTRADGTLAVRYSGARRVQLLMVERHEPYATVAVEHYDDAPTPDLDPTVDVLEKEAAQLLQRVGAQHSRHQGGMRAATAAPPSGRASALLPPTPPRTPVRASRVPRSTALRRSRRCLL